MNPPDFRRIQDNGSRAAGDPVRIEATPFHAYDFLKSEASGDGFGDSIAVRRGGDSSKHCAGRSPIGMVLVVTGPIVRSVFSQPGSGAHANPENDGDQGYVWASGPG